MTVPAVLAFSGSVRADSLNRKILAVAVQAARDAGLSVTELNLADWPLPIYNGDDEAAHGLPENAKALKAMLAAHQGLLIASPEYNGGYPALLKNMIDWTSRAEGDESPRQAYANLRAIALLSASPGQYGGARGLAVLRTLFEHCQLPVIAAGASIGRAHETFNAQGALVDVEAQTQLAAVAQALAAALGEPLDAGRAGT